MLWWRRLSGSYLLCSEETIPYVICLCRAGSALNAGTDTSS